MSTAHTETRQGARVDQHGGPYDEQGGDQPGDQSGEPGGERIEQLMTSFAASGPLAQQRAEELVRLVVEWHGSGLNRVLEIADDAGALTDQLLDRLADDDLVSGLLLLHGIHPYDVHTRIERALDRVRPYMGSHGGDVRLLEVTDDGVARLRMLGNCQGCPSSAVTLKLAVEGAVEAAAPEVERIECDDSPEDADAPSLIPLGSLFQRVHAQDGPPGSGHEGAQGAVWETVALPDLASGQTRAITVADTDVVLCRVGPDHYAYRDRCASCGGGLGGASLQRVAGSAAGSAALVCPRCRAHFDVREAGVELRDANLHLEPLPLLVSEGSVEIALPKGVPA